MVILHAYIRRSGNIVASLPFRYNNGDETVITARELVVDVDEDATYDSVRQIIVKQLDEEKQNVEYTDDLSGGMPCVVTIE